MASPFPGMDPYLEGEMWQEFHGTLIGTIRAQLMPVLRPKYVALLAKRYIVDQSALSLLDIEPERVVYPDIAISRSEAFESIMVDTATSVMTPPVFELDLAQAPQLSIEIRDLAQRRLVTNIELLSPSNKHGAGYREYTERRDTILKGGAHLVEIDLLRQGQRLFYDDQIVDAPYYVYVTWARRNRTLGWAIALPQQLPTIPVPLLAPDPSVALNLQTALAACFDLVGYEALLDYTQSPPLPVMKDTDLTWIDQRLRETDYRKL